MAERGRTRSFDIDTGMMRIIASFFVVLIHASGMASKRAIFFNSVSRFSVPVFVMISGYYMLSKEPDIKRLLGKSLKLLLQMVLWSGLYYACGYPASSGMTPKETGLFTYLLTEPVHLWYCYATAALYIFTPVLYIFHKNADRRQYKYALVLCFLLGSAVTTLLRSGLFPLLDALLDKMKAPYTLGFMGFYLLGGYLRKYGAEQKTRKALYLFGGLGVAVTFAGTLALPTLGLPKELLFSFFAPNVMVTGAAFFVLFKYMSPRFEAFSEGGRRFVQGLSECTLGIYLIHPLSLMAFGRLVRPHLLFLSPAALIPLTAVFAFVSSAIAVWILKRIPILNKLV